MEGRCGWCGWVCRPGSEELETCTPAFGVVWGRDASDGGLFGIGIAIGIGIEPDSSL